jgi:iron complex outermembrane receptor protein
MLTFCAAVFLLAGHVQAQEQEPDTIPPIPLAPVVVTVFRAPMELARVPFAVTVNSGPEVARARPGLGLDEALRGVPGLQVDNRYNYALGERISIRGFGARAQFGVRGVKVLLDGIPATLPDGQTTLNQVDLATLQRVEVIRGPASALYGNAAGGVIQLETAEPPQGALVQQAGVTAGQNGLLRMHSSTGGRSGRASYLLTASRLSYQGHREFNAAENLHLNARVGYHTGADDVRLVINAVHYNAENPGSLSDSLLRVDRGQAFSFNKLQQTGEEGRHGQLGVVWRRTMEAGELEVSGYALARRLDNPIPPRIIDLERAGGGARAVFGSRLVAGPREVRWTVGAETDIQHDDRKNFQNERGQRGELVLDQREQVTSRAAFGQLAAELLPRLDVLGGVRYDRMYFRADDDLISPTNPDDSGDRTMDAVSPSVGLSYTVAAPLAVYTNVATSFETPTTTELVNRPSGAGGLNPELDPQRTLSYEVGARGRLGVRATYQLAAYRAAVKNFLIAFEVPDAPGRQFFRNAGSAIHRGVETAATYAPFEQLVARATYTFTDARFDEYAVAGTEYDGNQVPGVVPHRAELGLTYQARSRWFVGLEARYASETPVDDANSAFSGSYTVVDLRAGLGGLRLGSVTVAPFVGASNVLDTEYNTAISINAFGRRFYEPGPGRMWYVGVNAAVGRE